MYKTIQLCTTCSEGIKKIQNNAYKRLFISCPANVFRRITVDLVECSSWETSKLLLLQTCHTRKGYSLDYLLYDLYSYAHMLVAGVFEVNFLWPHRCFYTTFVVIMTRSQWFVCLCRLPSFQLVILLGNRRKVGKKTRINEVDVDRFKCSFRKCACVRVVTGVCKCVYLCAF